MSKKKTTQSEVASKIGIDKSTFYRKMSGSGENFTIGEISKIANVIPLTYEEAIDIFFNFDLQKCENKNAI